MEKISGNSLIVKEVNINLVRKILKEMRQATKQQIAEAAGLSVMTVGTVLQQLIKENEVFEAELSLSRGGRPAQQFKYNGDYALVLILYPHDEDGVSFIHSTVVNLFGQYVAEKEHIAKNVNLANFEEIIDEYLGAFPVIKAIGLGLPGAEYGGKMIVSDYKALLGVSITEYFGTRYKMPVIMENDVNAAVIGFASRNASADDAIIYLYFPEHYPPGAGIFINGSLYKGKRNFAGEIANIPLDILWTDAKLYASFDLVCEAITKLIIAVCSVLNPDTVVLQGGFLNQEHINAALEKCSVELPPSAVPKLLFSENFADDFLCGMIAQTLATLEPGIVLTKN